MRIATQGKSYIALLGALLAVVAAVPAQGAEEPPYEADPVFSLLGDCEVESVDPVPDPSCPYPPPPAGPALSNCGGTPVVCTSRFDKPRAVVVDRHGNQYVISWADEGAAGRADVFNDEGRFVTEFAVPNFRRAAIDKEGNLYVFEDSGDVVRYEPSAYEPEEPEAGEISYADPPVPVASGAISGAVAVDAATDQLLIARSGKVFLYKSAAEGNEFIASAEPEGLGVWTEAMTVDAQRRRIYVSYCADANEDCGIKVLNADNPVEVLETIDGSSVPAGEFASFSGLLPVAADEKSGDVLVADPAAKTIYRFDAAYGFLSQQKFAELRPASGIAISNGSRAPGAEACNHPTAPAPQAGDACNRHYLFITVFETKGRLAALRPANQTKPVVESVAVGGLSENEAELEARIDPRGLDTGYHFELATLAEWEAEGFAGATTIPGGTVPAESLPGPASALATGLVAGQSYRLRVVAENDLGKAPEEGQNETTFTTYEDASIGGGCPNEALRRGPSVLLPDCRAYELVSPPETNGRAPKGTAEGANAFPTLQVSPAGEAASFTIEGGSVPGSSGVGSFGGDAYVARRGGGGWETELAGPTGAEVTRSSPGNFSPDQGYAFWRALGEGPLGPKGSIYNEYLRYPDGHSELTGRGSEGIEPFAAGKLITEDGAHVVFQSINLGFNKAVKLEPDAPPQGTTAVYDRTIDPLSGAEQTHTVSLLPGDITPTAGQNATYVGASKDGAGIAFEITGTLYLRLDNTTTYEIGSGVNYAGISEGGGRIFYLEGGDLLAFDTGTEEVTEFSTTGNVTPVNVAAGGTRAYFVSPSVLAGTNPQGDEATGGKQNLYLSEEGTISFIATVTDRDVKGVGIDDGLGLWTQVVSGQAAKDPSRLNPDGSVMVFQSRANITGYPAGEDPQIYRYDSEAGDLRCLSCIPTGVPTGGGASLESYASSLLTRPEPFSAYAFVPGLTPGGNRVFFDSAEALVSTDSDQVTDVYEWEAQGTGSCTRPDGCIYLISSGQSEAANFLYGHSADGRDVFFTSGDRLTGADSAGGAISIYDARVNGGFPEPAEEQCAGEGCRPSVTPPPVFERTRAGGPGDIPPKKTTKHCPKGKRKVKRNGRIRCEKKKHHKAAKHRGAAKSRRAGR